MLRTDSKNTVQWSENLLRYPDVHRSMILLSGMHRISQLGLTARGDLKGLFQREGRN